MIAVLGAGAFGITLAMLLSKNKHKVIVWSHNKTELIKMSRTRYHKNLPNIKIPDDIIFDTNIQEVVIKSSIILISVSSLYVRDIVEQIKDYIKENTIIVIVAKGIEQATLFTMSMVVKDVLKNVKTENISIVTLSGPSLAKEVAEDMPTAIVSASKNPISNKRIQDIFMNENFRVYTNDAIECVELCGALKNIYALCCGIAIGLGFGDNTRAAIITRGLAEIMRLGKAMNYNNNTFFGLAGLGDLTVTCMSEKSRNTKCGILIGQGKNVDDAVKEVGMVVEGINCLPAAYKLKEKYNVDMPLCDGMYEVIYNKKSALDILNKLMLREKKKE